MLGFCAGAGGNGWLARDIDARLHGCGAVARRIDQERIGERARLLRVLVFVGRRLGCGRQGVGGNRAGDLGIAVEGLRERAQGFLTRVDHALDVREIGKLTVDLLLIDEFGRAQPFDFGGQRRDLRVLRARSLRLREGDPLHNAVAEHEKDRCDAGPDRKQNGRAERRQISATRNARCGGHPVIGMAPAEAVARVRMI